MKVNIVCPLCHEKKGYKGGDVTIFFCDDEIGKKQEIEITHCDKCGSNIGAFFLKIETTTGRVQ